VFITAGPVTKLFAGGGRRRVEDMCYDRRRAEACVDESAHHALGPVRNPVFLHRVRLFVFLSFGNRTQNSRVAGARPNHQADRGSDPNHRGIWSPPMAESHKTLFDFRRIFPESFMCVCVCVYYCRTWIHTHEVSI
jgi:hypothetical protein